MGPHFAYRISYSNITKVLSLLNVTICIRNLDTFAYYSFKNFVIVFYANSVNSFESHNEDL
jgi:hypothetical protein